jgi:hypothetical protein
MFVDTEIVAEEALAQSGEIAPSNFSMFGFEFLWKLLHKSEYQFKLIDCENFSVPVGVVIVEANTFDAFFDSAYCIENQIQIIVKFVVHHFGLSLITRSLYDWEN